MSELMIASLLMSHGVEGEGRMVGRWRVWEAFLGHRAADILRLGLEALGVVALVSSSSRGGCTLIAIVMDPPKPSALYDEDEDEPTVPEAPIPMLDLVNS